MALLQLPKNRDGLQARRALEQRHDFFIPQFGERIWPTAAMTSLPATLRWRPGIFLYPVARAGGEASHGGGGFLRVFLTKGHVVPLLLVGDGTARHPILFLALKIGPS
ncbi:hypothetical protein V474_12605 [Novosphingobium barchaimii LL02]|uniref:Uncharacterized protein n=1 Tax=Novosphingobium barchaimii LL02 TaxID=1114963 RepID=A0A0J7XF52_9SPHN|nr:hypothetical protein V474_12605 [Novosphingobium barchaimii LL02]